MQIRCLAGASHAASAVRGATCASALARYAVATSPGAALAYRPVAALMRAWSEEDRLVANMMKRSVHAIPSGRLRRSRPDVTGIERALL